ncbi:sigma-E factor negative regulatory protein [uncultured Ramlibacter sp.]|uniref:sigma-E factor negative regulatory protein n=1 Tax=uncultured Ramlibacter sp. TaxID=260755 RepID=UPI00261AA6E9|nr:sigma-E factor negative regulatory protein [uncultured Ramlibacter sp.]
MMTTQETISALADGQLQGEEFARCVQLVAHDPSARDTWQAYHLIGDVLRSSELAAGPVDTAFLAKLQLRLAQEPSFAINSIASEVQSTVAHGQSGAAKPAVNDASFRWKMVAGVASMAAVAAIGWTVLASQSGKPEQAQLAAAPAPVGSGVMIRDARLDELMAAHRQFGGASALQAPAGFLRNATFEGPAR